MNYYISTAPFSPGYNWVYSPKDDSPYILSWLNSSTSPPIPYIGAWSIDGVIGDDVQITINAPDGSGHVFYDSKKSALQFQGLATSFKLSRALSDNFYFITTPDGYSVNVNTSAPLNRLVVGKSALTQWTFVNQA